MSLLPAAIDATCILYIQGNVAPTSVLGKGFNMMIGVAYGVAKLAQGCIVNIGLRRSCGMSSVRPP